MSPDFSPAVLFATGCGKANDWLTTNATRRHPVSSVVWRALRLTEMVMQYETEDNFPDLLAAWEKGFDSLIPPTTATAGTGNAPALLVELRHADTIIKAMLNAMTAQQKARVAEKLEADGVVTDGMSRHHERRAAIEAAKAEHDTAGDRPGSKVLLDIQARASDAAAQAADIAHLLQATFEKLDELSAVGGQMVSLVNAANCFATCAARNVELIREATADIIALAQEEDAQ
ncbi:hypothetical protein SAMN05428959_10820 [Duganella sp. CF517]|uniref:hypothetical protein n=1 Tax=Duganella sp. CF517 TaxID=1881038 RepID=UPI0008C2542D|nr:hypothetical protein [Duganella sp. CF517]SEO43873.1 hypothetical protein SAMN05428959_10820 [Duganella sp. CF517]